MKPVRLSPCKDCPFRNDRAGYLTQGRVRDLEQALVREGNTFPCHKTLDYDNEEGDGQYRDGTQMCAGAAILLQKKGRPNTVMQIAQRLGLFNPDDLDMGAPVHDTFAEMIKAQPLR